jgi:drug/metabolite transporter (DMT)-like permease
MNSLRRPSSARGYFLAFVATAFWSTTAVIIGHLTTRFRLPPLVLAFWRDFIVAGTVFGAIALVARPLLHLERRHVPFFVLYGFILGVFNAMWTVSVVLNGAAVATVLNHTAPAFTALVGWRRWGERLDAPKVVAIALSISGVALTSGAYDRAAWQVNPAGIVVGLATGGAFAAYSLLGKSSSRRGVDPWTATLYSFAIGATFLLLLQRPDTLLWLSRPLAAGPGGGREAALGWGLLVLLAVVPTLGGYGLYTVSLTHLPASTASLIVTLEPVMTAALAFVFLGERLTAPQTLGGGLILTGVVLLRLSDRVANGARTPPLSGFHGSRSRSPSSGTGRRAAPGEAPPPGRT